MRIGIHTALAGATERFHEVASALQAEVFTWMEQNAVRDARAYPDATHILRLPNPQPGEGYAHWADRIDGLARSWATGGIPPGALLFQNANEPDVAGYDLPVPWDIDRWLASHAGYVSELRARFPDVTCLAPPFTCANTKRITAAYVQAYQGIAVHAYWSAGNPGWRQGRDGGAAWRCATDLGVPCYVTEINSNPTDAAEIVAWINEVDSPLVLGATLFIADSPQSFPEYTITTEQAADILAHYRQDVPPAPPRPEPPPPEEPMTYSRESDPRGYRPLHPGWRPFLAAHNPQEADTICNAYEEGCRVIDYDANCAIAQGCVETAVFTSPRWRNAHNAAGIGIYADATPDVQFGDVGTGVRAQCELLSDYYCGGAEPWGILRRFAFGGMNLGKTRLRDMDGVWAADTGYSAAIVGYLDQVTGGGVIDAPTWVTGAQVVAAGMRWLGMDTFVDEGATVPSYYRCEEFVEVAEEDCGLSRLRYVDANADGDSGPLNQGIAPIGARVFFKGPGWSVYGHVGHALGDGRTLSALTVVSIKEGWQDPALGYQGWRYAPGVGPVVDPVVDPVVVVPKYRKLRRPQVGDGFNKAELLRLWYGTSRPTKAMLANYPYNEGFGIEASYGQLANGTFSQHDQDYTGLSIVLGQCLSKEEPDAGTPGRSVRYFQNGKLTAIRNVDGTYSFRLN